MPWLIARYQPSSLFSLKQGDATSTGAKSLLLPTPFAVRMALLDAAIRTAGVAEGPRAFETIKALRLAVRPPAYAAVSSTFLKVLKPEREAEARGRAMTRTIAFREYVHLAGELAIAFGGPEDGLAAIRPWLMQISYFGKRGGFYQLLALPEYLDLPSDRLPEGFLPFPERIGASRNSFPLDVLQRVDEDLPSDRLPEGFLPFPERIGASRNSFPLGVLQRVDEWGAQMTFNQANIYNRGKGSEIKLGKERLRLNVILPYQLVRAGRGVALYARF